VGNGKRRNTRRHRRDPVRKPIAVRPAVVESGAPSAATAEPRLLPEYESQMFGITAQVPIDVVPLYAALSVVHQEMSGAPANSCVPVCHQLAGALGHLGFDVEVMAACATVYHREDQDTKFADVGVWEHPPKVRPDGTTDGHVVLWANSFKRLVDPTIVQAPKLLKGADADPSFTMPVVLPVASRDKLFGSGSLATPKGPFVISWMFFPEWTDLMTPVLDGDLGEALPYGTLGLAHAALEVMRALRQVRSDVRQLYSLYPRLGALLAGRQSLPALPAEPPAAFMRVRRAAGQ
jgi:hypothetical protein